MDIINMIWRNWISSAYMVECNGRNIGKWWIQFLCEYALVLQQFAALRWICALLNHMPVV